MDVRFCEEQEPLAERHTCELRVLASAFCALPRRALRRILFPLDKRLTWTSATWRKVDLEAQYADVIRLDSEWIVGKREVGNVRSASTACLTP
jgi:hypothetical protein